jgi:hypothetical protein
MEKIILCYFLRDHLSAKGTQSSVSLFFLLRLRKIWRIDYKKRLTWLHVHAFRLTGSTKPSHFIKAEVFFIKPFLVYCFKFQSKEREEKWNFTKIDEAMAIELAVDSDDDKRHWEGWQCVGGSGGTPQRVLVVNGGVTCSIVGWRGRKPTGGE